MVLFILCEIVAGLLLQVVWYNSFFFVNDGSHYHYIILLPNFKGDTLPPVCRQRQPAHRVSCGKHANVGLSVHQKNDVWLCWVTIFPYFFFVSNDSWLLVVVLTHKSILTSPVSK